MKTLYIFDPNNFDGSFLNTMASKEGKPEYVDYMDKPTTFEEYKKQKGIDTLVALEWEEFYSKYYEPHLKGLQKAFKEITEEAYWDMLECLPPKRWTKFPGGEFFFMGECYTANLYTCCVQKGDKYYTALRSITTKDEDLIELKNV